MNENEQRMYLEASVPAEITEGATALDVRTWAFKSGYRAALEDLRAGRIPGHGLVDIEYCECECTEDND